MEGKMDKATGISLIIAASFMAALAPAASLASHEPGVKAFDHTAQKVPKPPEWTEKPIAYEKWAQKADLAVTLDQHLYAVMLPLVQEFARENNIFIAVKEGTCGISAGMLETKSVDLAGFCCPAGRGDRLPGLEFHTVGIAPLAIIVHRDNPVDGISSAEVRELFSGEKRNWKDVGGPDMKISPIARLHCKARPGHWRLILDSEDDFSHTLQEVGTIPDMVHAVASNKKAVGHLATWNIQKYADKWKVKPLTIDGLSHGDTEALLKGMYPFYRSYNITSWSGKHSRKTARGLVEYLIDNARRVDSGFHMVPASKLRKAGWKFIGDELVGEPGK
jgi:hypothetical protein